MHKLIHKSWRAEIEAEAEAGAGALPTAVALDFAGTFSEGSHEGMAFAGRIHFDPAAAPSERHISFALYEEWPTPVVTIAIGGQVMVAQGAAVYDSIFDGTASHYDFVTMYGTGPFDGVAEAGFFELYFADDDGATLDGTHMPAMQQLCAMPVKQVSFGTDRPGNVMSIGTFTLTVPG